MWTTLTYRECIIEQTESYTVTRGEESRAVVMLLAFEGHLELIWPVNFHSLASHSRSGMHRAIGEPQGVGELYWLPEWKLVEF